MDVQDLQKKLAFPDQSIQCRSISKLIDVIIKKKPKGIVSTDQFAEILALWEACGAENQSSASFAIEGVISLVTNGHMHVDNAINNLLSVAASARNTLALLTGLTKLLILQASAEDDFEKTKYSLQYPKHPFISILSSKPDTWPLLSGCMSSVILNSRNGVSSQVFKSMVPFMDYVFLNPDESMEMMMLQNLLMQEFSRNGTKPHEILKYCCRVLSWLQVKSHLQCVQASHFLSRLKVIISSDENEKDMNLIENLLHLSLVLANSCLDTAANPAMALELAEDLVSDLTTDSAPSACMNACFAVISVILPRASGDVAQKLLKIGLLLLDKRKICRGIAAMAAVPAVHLLSEPKVISFASDKNCTNSVPQLLEKLQQCFNGKHTHHTTEQQKFSSYVKHLEAFNSVCVEAILCVDYACEFETWSEEMKIQWLSRTKKYAGSSNPEPISSFLFNFTAGHLLLPDISISMCKACLEALEVFCRKNTELSAKMFSLLMYKQAYEKNPETVLLMIEYLARTATHKYAVAPVLNILQMMSKHQELKAQTIYFMHHLWKKQNRCFPYLEKVLTEKDLMISFDSGIPEVRIAQAAIIRQLCTEVPDKCSGPFLGTLSAIINESSTEAAAPAAILAVDAVFQLCKAEVIDLRTAWKALSPKLGRDKRPLVSSRLCNLLSLVPDLLVKSSLYEKFMNEAATYLWRVIVNLSDSPIVLSAAYKALSGFPMECHNLKQLPVAAKVNLKLPASMVSTPFEMGKSPEDVLTYIPGYCYVDLLNSISDPEILEGYGCFLESLVMQEVKSLPQSVYFKRKPVGRKRDPSDVLSSLPGILCTQFDVLSSVAVRKNLAVGILLSYEPPMRYDREGKPTKQCIAAHLGMYKQIFEMLLNEVNLDGNDWQRCLLIPNAWKSFMGKAFFACEESLKVDIELQRSSGRLKGSTEEIKQHFETAWLWVRDDLLNFIKVTSKATTNAMANSAFALAGLISAVDRFYAGLDTSARKVSNECERYIKHQDFLLRGTETLITAWNSHYRCTSKPFDVLQMQSQSSSAASLVKGCIGASLFILVPQMKMLPDISFKQCFEILCHNMSSPSLTLSLYSGIGFGLFMQTVLKENEFQTSDEQCNFVLRVAEKLSQLCLEEDLKPGKMIGLTLCISALGESGNPTYSPWIKKTCQDVRDRLMEENPSSMDYECLSICGSSMVVSAASASILPHSTAEELMIWFEDRRKEMLQCTSTAISVALLSDGLLHLGNTKGVEMVTELKDVWFGVVRSEKKPTLQRIAALNGLCTLFSAGRGLVQMREMTTATANTGVKDLAQLMIQLLSAVRDSGLQSVSCWELGRLHALHTGLQNETSTESSTYSYLSERSVLKPLSKFVQICCTEGGNRRHLLLALKALGQKFQRPLPPINWITFLTPLLQKTDDAELLEASLKIAMCQMASSSSALSVFSSYSAPPLLLKLTADCHLMLLKHLTLIASSLSPARLQTFLHAFVLPSSKLKNKAVNEAVILEALLESHEYFTSNQGVKKILEDAFKTIVIGLSLETVKTQSDVICKFVTQMSEESQSSFFHELKSNDFLCTESFILGCLIKTGKKPLSCIKPCLEDAKYESPAIKSTVITVLLECIADGMNEPESSVSKVENVVSLLMETIGWITVLLDTCGENRLESSEEVARFLNQVCLAILIGASGYRINYAMWPNEKIGERKLICALPASLYALASHSGWDKHMDKIIDWILKWKENPCLLGIEDSNHAFTALCSLRSCEAYQKSKWTKIISILD